jgi:hypothetical protein
MAERNPEAEMQPLTTQSESPSEPTVEKPKNGGYTSSQQFKLLLLFLMVAQNSSAVLVGRHTRSSVPDDELYSVNHLICFCELLKVGTEQSDEAARVNVLFLYCHDSSWCTTHSLFFPISSFCRVSWNTREPMDS